jgi:hypothetical protein
MKASRSLAAFAPRRYRIAVVIPAERGGFRGVDAPEANAGAVYLDGVAIDDAGSAGEVGGEGRPGQREEQQGGSAPVSRRGQEQIQMITMVMGRATPNAPPIIIANADSKLASACTSCPDIAVAPASPSPIGSKVDLYG